MTRKIRWLSTLVLNGSMLSSLAANFSANFNDGQVPAGTAVYGSAVVEGNGGVGDSGALKLTKAANGQQGSFIIEDFDEGQPVYGISVRFKVRVGGGTATPADGFSFSWAPDVADGPFGEGGSGNGFTVEFDTYDNGGGEAPAIDIRSAGTVIASTRLTIPEITTGSQFEDVVIDMRANGLLDLTYKGNAIYTGLPVPGLTFDGGWRYGFGARTGGLNANHFIDDLQITTVLQPAVGIIRQPQSKTVMAGTTANLEVGVNNPEGVTFQWFRNGVAISGATSQTLSLANIAVAEHGNKFKVEVRGPNNTLTSDEVTLSVVEINVPAVPQLSINFNDGLTPIDSAVFGTAFVVGAGGVNDSGALLLTEAINDSSGSFIVNDPRAGAPVYGFTAAFKVRVGGGTPVPADGFSFNFANDLPEDVFPTAEEGAGTGLTIAFDTYNNGAGEAPAIDVKYGGQVLATTKVPIDLLTTDDQYVPVVVNLEDDGTLDVVYDGSIIYNDFAVTGFTSMTGGRFGWAARTGGLNANHFVDDIALTTDIVPGDLRIAAQPSNTAVLVGQTAEFSAEVNNSTGVTFQWFKNGAPITGATGATLTTAPATAADDQAKFKVVATGLGNVTVESDEAVLTVINLQTPSNPTLSLDFNNGQLPAGTSVHGVATVEPAGGVNGSGFVMLTPAENSNSGAFVIQPLESGAELAGFTVSFKVLVGGGSAVPADGFSFNFGSDVPNGTIGDAEEGAGTGLTIAFDTYNNGGGEAPAIDVKFGSQVIMSTKVDISQLLTEDQFVEVLAQLKADGTFSLAYDGEVIYANLPIPNYRAIAGAKFGWAARTGGLNANHWLDDIRIATVRATGPLRFVEEPQNLVILGGSPAVLTARVNDPQGVTFQWLREGAPIAGATSATLTTTPLTAADTGAQFSLRATRGAETITSANAAVTVISPITVAAPDIALNFDDGTQPPGTEIAGTAFIDLVDGVGGSGVLKLTVAENGQQGAFYIPDARNGTAVSAFTAHFKVRVGGGTSTPADGFSFVWSSDLDVTTAFGEEGIGSGLVVSFDIYNNSPAGTPAEAPAIDVRFAGETAASTKLPIETIRTGDEYADVVVRVESDGTLDLIYDGNVIYFNLPLPGFTAIANGMFAFGGRTGGLNENQWVDEIRIATSTGAAAPTISSIRLSQGNVVIEWAGTATLQSAPTVTGPWTNVANASSPHSISATEPHRFFRLAR